MHTMDDLKIQNVQLLSMGATIYNPRSHSPKSLSQKFILLLHGWMGNRHDMAFLATSFANQGYTAVAMDLPYHGDSINSMPTSCPTAAAVISDCMSAVLERYASGPHSIAILGYSLGGRLALQIAALAIKPQQLKFTIQALVLISCAAPPSNESDRLHSQQISRSLARKLSETISTSQDFETWLRLNWYSCPMWGQIRDNPVFDQLVSHRLHCFNQTQLNRWALSVQHLSRSTMTPLSDLLHVPVLYLYGALDTKYENMSFELQQSCSHFRSFGVKRSGHMVQLEFPDIVVAQSSTFLSSIFPTSPNACDVVKEVIFSTYSIPLRKQMLVGSHNIISRDGIVVGLLSSSGLLGIGDICPLPGLHSESLSDCIGEIRAFSSKLRLPDSCVQVNSNRDAWKFMEDIQAYSGVSRNGLEAAFLHLLSRVQGKSISCCVCSLVADSFSETEYTASESVKINGVMPRMQSVSASRHVAIAASQHGNLVQNSVFKTMKVKVGSFDDVNDDAKLAKGVVAAAGAVEKRIRFDANRAWTKEQFEIFQCALANDAMYIDFIEEPLKSSVMLKHYLETTSHPHARLGIALDESLHDCCLQTVESMAAHKLCKAFIIKPSVIGSLQKLFKLVAVAAKHECDIILSTAFESGVGTAWVSVLASVFGRQNQFHGLGTFAHLDGDVINLTFAEHCEEQGTEICTRRCEQFLLSVAKNLYNERNSLGSEN